MKGAVLVLSSDAIRTKAKHWVDIAPLDSRVMFSRPRRTIPQNSRLWAMLTDVAEQVEYYGKKRSPEDWKVIFTAALSKEIEMVPGLDGRSFVALGLSTSKMDKQEHGALMDLIEAYGAEHGVKFQDSPIQEGA